MNKLVKQNINKILEVFILLQPIIDLITGICLNIFNLNLTLGIIIRTLFLGFIMYTTVFIYKKKKSLIYYLILIIYGSLYIIGNIIFKDASLFTELQGLLRVFYFPILLISLYDIKDEIRIAKSTLVATLLIYLLFIFIPILLNIGFKSYEITKSGTLGFYNSANEISGIISLLTPILFIIFKEKMSIFLKIIITFLYLFVILTVGTKTPLLSLLITIGMTFLWLVVDYIKNKKYVKIFISLSIIIVGLLSLAVIIPKTNFYKNIKVHLDYLEVTNIKDVFKEEQLVDHFIFSERITFFTDKMHIYNNSNLYQKLFGIGYVNDNKTTKLIEIDYYDIYFSHGIIGFLVFILIPIYVLIKLALTKRIFNYENYMVNVSFLLVVILSFFTGHIITAPAVSIFVCVIFLCLDHQHKKNLLFAAVNLDIGGIETALINLLQKIDYDKYNTTVVLEEKNGIFLKDVPPEVTIKEVKVSNNSNILIRKAANFYRKLIFTIFNYHSYDFSCCYATYSLSSNVLARIASKNNSIYIHSNYKFLYPKESDFRNFFDARNIYSFRKIIFVSNEAKEEFLKIYKDLSEKAIVLNNFINIEKIKKLSEEKIEVPLKVLKDEKLFVFIGRLDDSSKKLKRAIDLIKNIENTKLWIVGDGKDRALYEEYTAECNLNSRITFTGKKQNPYPYMKQADYILLTSDYEGFPVTYLESIVLKKQIITTINASDEAINIGNEYAYIVSKDERKMLKEVSTIIEKKAKYKNIDLGEIQTMRMAKFEKIFDEVI